MKPAPLLLSLVLTTAWIPVGETWAENVEPPVPPETPAPARPLDLEKHLPSSVTHTTNPEGQHVITVTGIAADRKREEVPLDARSFAQTSLDGSPSIPGKVSFEMKHEEGKAILITSRELAITEVISVIGELSKSRSDFPSYSEILARDLPLADGHRPDLYLSASRAGEFPAGLDWSWLPPRTTTTTPFVTPLETEPGSLFITPAPVPIGSDARFTLRILDSSGKLLWSHLTTGSGAIRFATADTDGDGKSEIFLAATPRDGTESRFHIAPK